MKTGLAKISVRNSFCSNCSEKIENALTAIRDISNVHLYPSEALIVFSFRKANELAVALNTLTDLGYPPKSDSLNPNNKIKPSCICMRPAMQEALPAGFNELYRIPGKAAEKQLNIAS
ncbi:hypothetical protein [Poritiphilus flavus]|uniref:Uncharacterized protein n=1 Tax=Poritiphilus flavus TaxID=2697053 RepID=A0A6L9E7E5_9FLAO|nr:hypothetical protein [Poritiphilus flavus]NAS10705.1 hypothetical protein [Poritiphilus flavus]